MTWNVLPPAARTIALVWDGAAYLVAAGEPDGSWWVGGSRLPTARVLAWMPVPPPPAPDPAEWADEYLSADPAVFVLSAYWRAGRLMVVAERNGQRQHLDLTDAWTTEHGALR